MKLVRVPKAAINAITRLINEEIKNTERFRSVNGSATDGHLALMQEAREAFLNAEDAARYGPYA